MRFYISTEQDKHRAEIEAFIHTCYAKSYAADIQKFMPTLLAVRHSSGKLLAAAGIRIANNNDLYLEQYLEQPAEAILSQSFKQVVKRHQIVEIGNLASTNTRAMQWLLVQLNAYLYEQHYQWAIFTVVPKLYHGLCRQGLQLEVLTTACKQCLSAEEQTTWGSYYDKTPLVAVTNLTQSYQQLKQPIPKASPFNQIWSEVCPSL